MHTLSTQTIISHPLFLLLLLPPHSHYLHFSSCFFTSHSPLVSLHSLFLSSLHPFRQRQIRWRPARRAAVSPRRPLTPNWQSGPRMRLRLERWAVLFPMLSVWRGSTSNETTLGPLSRWGQTLTGPNCCGLLLEPPPPPKPRASGSPLTAVYPKLAWGELRLSNPCAMRWNFFL